LLLPGDLILAYKVDRCFRNVADGATMFNFWHGRGIIFHSSDGTMNMATANGRAFAQMCLVFAEWESAIKSERIKSSFAERKKNGRQWTRWAPYGFSWVGPKGHKRLVLNMRDRQIGQQIVRLRDDMLLSWEAIADDIERSFCEAEHRIYRERSAFRPRRWSWQRCQRSYHAERELQEKGL
jgi:DNA invertase Pin-like site-specific DNA recombinase